MVTEISKIKLHTHKAKINQEIFDEMIPYGITEY
jgi:hypothetical protein